MRIRERSYAPVGPLAAVAALCLALPSAASGATASLTPGDPDSPSRIAYTAAAGEANKLDVQVAADRRSAEISDPGADSIVPGANCAAQNAKKVTCTVPAGRPDLLVVEAELGDGNDTFDIAGASAGARGGPGNDTLRGGPNADILRGGGGTDELRGNGGDDSLYDEDTSGAANGDKLDGGAGSDTVVYERTAAVNVDLANPSGDGEPGENDELDEIENASGGAGNDTIRGTDGPNRLGGAGGQNTVEGRGDRDVLLGGDDEDTLIGGPGRDDIESAGGDDTLRLENPVGEYDRLLTCGSGKDTIVGIAASPSVSINCEVGDFGFGFVAGLKPKKVTKEAVTVRIPCPDAYKKDGACKGSIVVEPTGAYNRTAAERKAQRYGAKEFKITKSTKVTIKLNSAGRKQLRKSAFKLQFTINMKETATKTKRRFEWTSYLVRAFL